MACELHPGRWVPGSASSIPSGAPLRPGDLGIGQLFSRIREALVVADATTGRILLWNAAAEQLFGYSSAEAIGMSVEVLIPPDLRARHRAGLAHYAATGKGTHIDRGEPFAGRAVTRDGASLLVEVSLSSLEAASAPGTYVVALIRDLTRRARGIGRLRRQAELLDLAPDAIFACDLADGTIVYWSAGAESLYGWTREEACGSPAHVLLGTRQPHDPAEIESAVLHTGGWEGELERTTREGRRVLVQSRWALQPESAEERAAILVIDTDLTQRRRVEEAQQRSSAALGAIIQSSPVAVFALDLFGNVQLWNPAAERMFGWQAAELLGRPSQILSAGQQEELMDLLERVRAGETITGLTTARQRRDGSTIDVSLSAAPLRGGESDGGPVHGMIVVLEDITERKQAAEERSRLKEAELALRERNQVLATVSHDLKTPLTVIRGQAQLLRRRVEHAQTLEPERVRKGLELIETATIRMTSWIDELLETAHLQAGRPVTLRQEPTDLVGLAWQAAADNQRLTERHRIRVESDERKLVGLWDATRLARVLDNLLGNAIKYSPEGGDISVRVAREGATAVLSVGDAGVGIPEADLPHIFERFRRGGNVVGRFAGSGIGLAGASQIVRQHGGTISVASQPGHGTVFTLRLPLDATEN